jgi:hypothetical protein
MAFGNSLGFQVQIEDLRSKCCTPKKTPKNNISGKTLYLRPAAFLAFLPET